MRWVAINIYRLRALLMLLLAVVSAAGILTLVLVVGAKPAEAAFPGGNGKIVFHSNQSTGTGVDNPTGDFEL